MFLIEKLELYPSFSPNEQVLVDYILTQREELADQTTADIAKATYLSKSSLVRMAQKLGYHGWSDFKTTFLEEMTYFHQQAGSIDANRPFESTDNYLQIASKIAQLKKEAIDETLSLIKARDINKAIQLLETAQTIHVFAVSNNLLNAQEFVHHMTRIQKDVRLHQLHGESLFNAYLAKEDSIALIISYSGFSITIDPICQLLKKKGIPIIGITSLGENPVSQLADVTLRLATKEKLYSKIGTFATDSSLTYLLDVLYASVFRKDYQANLNLRKQASQEIEYERYAHSKEE
ncbi:SIS domain-containing protein [Streptococcus pneumoniae]|nr:SIS domain-containing protein [Streptococcus pneumoniae]